MVTHDLQLGGAVVLWKIGPSSSLAAVRGAVEDLGPAFAPALPSARTPAAALQAALAEVIEPDEKGHKILVRPRKEDDTKAFAVLQENPKVKGETGMKTRMYAEIDNEETGEFSMCPHDTDLFIELCSRATLYRSELGASAVGRCLSLVVDILGGVSLREGGGVYWLSDAALPIWNEFSRKIEAAGDNNVYRLELKVTAEMIRCVGNRMQDEFGKELAQLNAELADFTATSATLEARKKRVEHLTRQVHNFEQAFACPLTALTNTLTETQTLFGLYDLAAQAARSPELMSQLVRCA